MVVRLVADARAAEQRGWRDLNKNGRKDVKRVALIGPLGDDPVEMPYNKDQPPSHL